MEYLCSNKQVKIAFFFVNADNPLGGGWEASFPYEKSRADEVRDWVFDGNRVCLVCCVGLNVDELASLFAGRENYDTVDESEKSVVFTHANVKTGVVSCATLTLQDVASLAL